MKVARIQLTRVKVPLESAFVSAHALLGYYEKIIISLHTDSGYVGLGETEGSPGVVTRLREFGCQLLGRDPLKWNCLRRELESNLVETPRDTRAALGGLEMACWDLIGHSRGVPVCELLGGRCRDIVPMVCELSAAPLPASATREAVEAFFAVRHNMDHVIEGVLNSIEEGGYRYLKLKSIGRDPEWDVHVMDALREALGDRVHLRWDPNGAYDESSALQVCRALDGLGLQWFEDPVAGLPALARLRAELQTPLATNMYVTAFDHLPTAISMGAVDVVGVDLFHWGGFANVRDLVGVCRVFNLGLFGHCFFDLGVTTAANLHIYAALPEMKNGFDTIGYIQSVDIVSKKFVVKDGCLDVPEGPGLGVSLDETAMARYSVDTVRLGD